VKYRTIVADPPWDYREVLPGHTPSNGSSHRHDFPYPTMTVADIEMMNVSGWADAGGCNLFCWTTNRYFPDAFHVVEAWGFTYTQTIVWRKTGNPPPHGGSIAPNHAEYLLVARRRGGARWLNRLPSSVVDVPRQSHSRKPDAFLDLIERVSPPPYLELFARRQRLGWDTWGNEALEHVEVGG
jgi:N6-adenosine-specific RNA methylase IME4